MSSTRKKKSRRRKRAARHKSGRSSAASACPRPRSRTSRKRRQLPVRLEIHAAAQGLSLRLAGSVGRGGDNRPEDVRAVKQRLRQLGFTWISETTAMDDSGIAAIRLFQAIKNGLHRVEHPRNDGRIDRGGSTHRWLEALNAPRWQVMPRGSREAGFLNYELLDETDQHDYGTSWMAETIIAAGAAYRDAHLSAHPAASLLTINDVSLPRGGNTPHHSTHETGLDCDCRLPRTDGASGGITWNLRGTMQPNPLYDREAARAMLRAIQRQPLWHRTLFNDPALIAEGLCIAAPGHDDHIHFEVRPPAPIHG